MLASCTALDMEVLPEVVRVECAARQFFLPLASDEPRPAQAEEDEVVRARVVADDLLQPFYERVLIVEAEEVITQVVAEGAAVFRRRVEEARRLDAPAGDEVESAAHEVGVTVQQRHQPSLIVRAEGRAV